MLTKDILNLHSIDILDQSLIGTWWILNWHHSWHSMDTQSTSWSTVGGRESTNFCRDAIDQYIQVSWCSADYWLTADRELIQELIKCWSGVGWVLIELLVKRRSRCQFSVDQGLIEMSVEYWSRADLGHQLTRNYRYIESTWSQVSCCDLG